MHTELGREERKQMLQGKEHSSCPKSLDPGFCPPTGVIKNRKERRADSPALRGNG